MKRLSRSNIRLLQSTGRSVAKISDKAAAGLFHWATTDHTGLSRRLANMPTMGFLDTVKYMLLQFLISIVAAVLTGLLIFVLIAYGIPFLLFGHL